MRRTSLYVRRRLVSGGRIGLKPTRSNSCSCVLRLLKSVGEPTAAGADWMETCTTPEDDRDWLVVSTAAAARHGGKATRPTSATQRVILALDARSVDSLLSRLEHLSPQSWRSGSCADSDSHDVLVSPSAVVVLLHRHGARLRARGGLHRKQESVGSMILQTIAKGLHHNYMQ